MPTPTEARDETFELFTDAWLAGTVLDPMPTIRYQGNEKGKVPDDYFVRLSMQQVSSPQTAFVMTDEPNSSPSLFETYGLVFAQIFAPMSAEDSWRIGDLLATHGRDIFRRVETPSGVTFRNARFNELDNDGKHYRWNVKVEYEFTERKG